MLDRRQPFRQASELGVHAQIHSIFVVLGSSIAERLLSVLDTDSVHQLQTETIILQTSY